MRRHLAAAAALSFALLAAGCSGDAQESTTAAPTPVTSAPAAGSADGSAAPAVSAPTAAAGAAGDAALSKDTDAICAQAARTSTSFGTNFAADYQVLRAAGKQGAEAKSRAAEKVDRTVDGYAFALLDMSKLAADPTVKKALAAMGAQVTALKSDLGKIDDEKLSELHAKLDKACGKS
ncbi:hypothetical protein [Actinoplanes palleronii]|uniref:Lipoprotein n=1 Tax=Actinoplanes palleronii TaxID=113570 RepID=A0ABQ4B2W1_9ACTN|nr:hypothetical protein [Actinoplanes palleronii]GIE64585.1 hypothetical protein Apa02nite_006930 [Actinoplanes palleronii]